MVRSIIRVLVAIVTSVLLAPVAMPVAMMAAQPATVTSLGSVNVSRRVLANGQPLAAGTYTLRVAADPISPVLGQTPAESRWVEFVRGGKVVGREVATVVTGAEAKAVLNGPGPASGSARTDMLKGNDYLRIWVNRRGTHYLVHLAVPKA